MSNFTIDHLKTSSLPLIRWRLAQLASHLVVALVALVVIGGSTRVMEAGLACPDWPLCYGSFLPGKQMNVQVFLEWFHRLDAFLVGVTLLAQFIVALIFKSKLPNYLIWIYGILLLLVGIQGLLGALTVIQLLPSSIVTAHLALALTLVALMSGISQRLVQVNRGPSPFWWRSMGLCSLFLVISQSLVGASMATTWASKKCLAQGLDCQLLDLHRLFAIPTTLFILAFVFSALIIGGWPRSQWPFLGFTVFLIALQIFLGITSVQSGLSEPLITISHQLIATLLVASLSSLIARRPYMPESLVPETPNESFLEVCHG